MTDQTQILQQRLQDDLRTAMRSGDTVARETIRFLLSAYRNAEIENRSGVTARPENERGLSAEQEIALLQRQVKQRSESIEQFQAAGRSDLVEKERGQLAVIERYLPAQLSDDELGDLVGAAVSESGATTIRDMGKVMAVLLPRVAGRADGRRVSEAVRARLTAG